jgi:hypothetical protein
MVDHAVPRKLWEHKNIQSTEMYKFMQVVNTTQGTKLEVKLQSRFWQVAAWCRVYSNPTADFHRALRLFHSK